MPELSHEGLLTASEMVGEPMDWVAGTTVIVKKRNGQYRVFVDGASFVVQCLNIAGSACALADGSELEFGGDRPKRVTVTENADEKYAYIEIMDR